MTFEEILSRFDVDKRRGDSAQCHCPAHADREASLTISRGIKGTVVCCHAKCSTESILSAVGLKMRDLFDGDLEPGERWQRYVEQRLQLRIDGIYHYHDQDGRYIFTKLRLFPKTFRYGVLKDDRFRLGGISRQAVPAAVYGDVSAVKAAIKEGRPVYYVEGEKDVETLRRRGYAALTCGGADDWDKRCAGIFAGADVVILSDNDQAGADLSNEVAESLEGVAKSIRALIVTPEKEKGDVSDFFEAGHTTDELDRLVADCKNSRIHEFKKAEEKLDLTRFHLVNLETGKITGVFDFEIFQFLKGREQLFVLGGVPWIYRGGVYVPDENGSTLKTMIRELIFPQFVKSTTIKRVFDLFTSAAELQRSFDQVNQFPATWINFENGFFDAASGQMLPHDPARYAINQIPHRYDPDADLPGDVIEAWLSFIVPDASDREMLLQFCGLCLTRDTRAQKFLVLRGEGGSGKSTVIRLLEAMVGGRNCSNISLAELSQRFASYGLLGKLVNSCADLELQALEDTSTLKKILGEDTLRGEQKGKDAVSFRSYAKLIFSTNDLPIVKGERTNGFFRRLLVLPMDRLPEKRRADFFDQLVSQLPYFLRLCVQALTRLYQSGGLIAESAASVEAVQQLRRDSDTVEAFLAEETVAAPGERVERGLLFDEYERHCRRNDRQNLSRTNFYKALRSKGFRDCASCGQRYFESIRLEKAALKTALSCSQVDQASGFQIIDDADLPFQSSLRADEKKNLLS